MAQIALVSDQHNHDVGVGVVPQLLKPPCHIVVCLVLTDVVYEQCTDCAAVVCGGDGSITFLTGGIPDLCLLKSTPYKNLFMQRLTLIVFVSTCMERVANSTPTADVSGLQYVDLGLTPVAGESHFLCSYGETSACGRHSNEKPHGSFGGGTYLYSWNQD